MHRTAVVGPVIVVVAGAACGRSEAPAKQSSPASDELSAGELLQLRAFSPLPPTLPPDPSNRHAGDPRAAALGQMLFFDEALSGPLLVDSALGKAGESGKLSCRAPCHAGPALDDQHSRPNHVSIGARIGHRNAPPVLLSSYYAWSNWGGRFDSQWALVLGAAENPDVMNGNRLAIAHTVFAKYRAEYDAIFAVPLEPSLDPAAKDAARFPPAGKPKAPGAADGAWEAMTAADREIVDRIFANVGKAVAAYMRTLVARDAPFDRFVAGDATAISASAKRGIRVFLRHCASCHAGPHFQDNAFHALAVAQFGASVPASDDGRFGDIPALLASPFNTGGPHSDGGDRITGLAQAPAQRGQFRTPTLRNVAVTAPYMHAGQFATLEAVVKFYNAGGGRDIDGVVKDPRMAPLGLTDAEQADLVEMMKTLTDTRIAPALLVDTSR